MKSVFWVITLLCLAMGCGDAPPTEVSKPGNRADTVMSLRYVMLNKGQCDLKGDQRETFVEDITGIWVDSLLWKNRRPDTCWYGVKCVDRRIRFELKSSKVFVWKEKYTDGIHDRTDKGEFFLSNDSSITTLMIASNNSVDTLFAQGDTMMGKEFQLNWRDNERLLLVPPRIGVADDDYEVYEMVRLSER